MKKEVIIYFCETCKAACIPFEMRSEKYGIPYLACPVCVNKVELIENKDEKAN